MKALIFSEERKAVVADVLEPKLRPDCFKVKSVAVAVNSSNTSVPESDPEKGN
jgi:hypothetical protein